jgi:hypothetical protein
MVDESVIQEAGRRLADAAGGDARVILFYSDLDLLVIEPEVRSRRAEFVRLRKRLRGLGIPIDLIVVDSSHVEEWGGTQGTMVYEALQEGRVLAGA